ncbi:AmmeMemoRadiSam system radical SAM enzyme [Candidatus Falkowbacteria bacterium]|nr:AmmeMemoRadiSam system radical SAM enzyme [Candidatus Falkowbacteria bacterium]
MEKELKEADFYKQKRSKMVECLLCSHRCLINEGGVGICRARKNINGKLFSLVYGQAVAMNLDPIEKKPLYHFLPGSDTLSFGTLGCNFHCQNCHNYQISQAEVDTDNSFTSPAEIIEMAVNTKASSISYTYNEPTIFFEYALETMKLAQAKGLKNVWVSNGYISKKALKELLPYLDAINIDLKSMDKDFYQKVCGAKPGPIIDNIKYLSKSKVHLEITTLIIPTLTDSLPNLKKIAKFIAGLNRDIPWHISRFSPEISWKLKELPPTNEWKMEKAHKAGRDVGLKYVYSSFGEENTRCPKCGQVNIKRFYYDVERSDDQGKCRRCGQDLKMIL